MTYRIYLRSHVANEQGRILERVEPTADPAFAEAAYRRLLARDDLIGESVAAVLSSTLPTGGGSGSAIYFSRFDTELGAGRIHANAPLDMLRADDGTDTASAWQPTQTMNVDYETVYPDDFPAALVAWRDAHDWSDAETARQLRTEYLTFRQWLTGRRKCASEKAMRRLMTLINTSESNRTVIRR